MKILIIPDVHGRDFWKEPCSHIDEFDKVVFLGDYHDPYLYQVSKDTSYQRLRDELVPWILEHKDKVVTLIGNHDIEYLIGVYVGCRYDYINASKIEHQLRLLPLIMTYQIDGYLFSHSGILPGWLEENNLKLEDINFRSLEDKVFMEISQYRGGQAKKGCSSCIWGDFYEYSWEPHLANVFQIFGHTQLKKDPIIGKDYACLDCRQAFILDTETRKIIPYSEFKC